MNELARSHDRFFKKLLSNPARAQEYLQAFLPAQVQGLLALETLHAEKDSFVNEQLKEAFSDLIFSARTLAGQYVNICFLFEHKSQSDKTAAFQILHYISSAMLKQAQNDEPPQLIIPILFYHGQEEWAYQPLGSFFEGLDEALAPYLPDFQYVYNNIQELPDEVLLAMLRNRLLQSALLTMKHYFDPAYLEENALFIIAGSRDEQGNFFVPLLVYYFDKVSSDEGRILEIINKLPQGVKSEVMSTLDIFIEKGVQIGIQKGEQMGIQKGEQMGIQKGEQIGIQKGEQMGEDRKTYLACCNLIKMGASNDFICQALEVDEKYVEQVREKLAQGEKGEAEA